jgi:hypothetical protein
MALAVQASAIELTPYGAVRVATWYNQTESYRAGTGASYTDSDLSHDIQGDSLFGLRLKDADFSGVFEMGAYNPKNYSGGPEIRLMFADWDFGAGTVRVGKAPSPYVYRTMQAWDSDGGMNGYGSLWDGRYGQVKVTMKNGFYVDVMQPRVGAAGNITSNDTNAGALAAFQQTGNVYPTAAYTDYDTFMPKIVAGYEGKLDKWTYGGGAAFNSYKIKTRTTATAATVTDDVTSYLLYFHGKIDLAPVELAYNVFGGQNVGDLMSSGASAYVPAGNGASVAGTGTGAYYDVANKSDATTYGGWGQIGYTANDKLKLYVGASYVVDKNDKAKSDDERLATFVNAQYQVSKYFLVVPEIDYIDDMKNTLGNKEPKIIAAGVKWEMKF